MNHEIPKAMKRKIVCIQLLMITLGGLTAQTPATKISFQPILKEDTPQIQTDFGFSEAGSSAIYDMDGDGDNDYLLISYFGYYKTIGFLNDGNGAFTKIQHDIEFNVGTAEIYPDLLHGDLNNDGIEDLIITGERFTNDFPNKDLGTRVYFGDTDGSLNYQASINLPSSYFGFLALEDLTGDDVLDILVNQPSEGGVLLFENDGSGNFTQNLITDLPTSLYSWNVTISEPYNGVRDIVIDALNASFTGAAHYIYRYDGTNYTLVGDHIIPGVEVEDHTHFGDANADGYPDIFYINTFSANGARLYLNDGTGNYTESTPESFEDIIEAYTYNMSIADLNNDSADELVYYKPNEEEQGGDLKILWNDGTGEYAEAISLANAGRSFFHDVSVGDINDDGYLDIFHLGQFYGGRRRFFQSWINDQAGGFDDVLVNPELSVFDGESRFEDMNGDGYPDLISSGGIYDEMDSVFKVASYLHYNDGTGQFTPVSSHGIDSLGKSSIALADVDGDGTNEMVIAGETNAGDAVTHLYKNIGGAFSHDVENTLKGVRSGAVEFLDANEDGQPDLLIVGENNLGNASTTLYLNNEGRFTETPSGLDDFKNAQLAIGDLNDDKIDDLIVCGEDATATLVTATYLGNGDGTYSKDLIHSFVAAEVPRLADIDEDDDLDVYLAGNGRQKIFLNDGTGSFSLHQDLDNVWNAETQFDDVDLDGDLDFIATGNWDGGDLIIAPVTYLFSNTGGVFTKEEHIPFIGVHDGSLDFVDIDGDLDNDLVLTGTASLIIAVDEYQTGVTRVYRNTTCTSEIITLDPIASCDPYDFYGTSLVASGFYLHNFTTSDGCDRTVFLQYTSLTSQSEETVSACESYEWNGTIYTTSGTYQELFTNAVGCDSTATLNLTILEPDEENVEVSACNNYEFDGSLLTSSGMYTATFANKVGCDSLVNLTLTILEPTSSEETVEACESYDWNSVTYATSGTYQELFTNAVGCDSTATLNLTILEPTSSVSTVEECVSYAWNGTTYSESGNYQEVFLNAAGCDSTATLNLTILEPTSSVSTVEECVSYAWNGTTYSESGTYQEMFLNAAGCDSTATLNLTILEPTSSVSTVEECVSYEWNGTTYSESGTYQEMFLNAAGCDSTATLNLTILEPTSSVSTVEECVSYVWNGTTYSESGTYQEIFLNAAGCDSTVTLNLTILEPTSSVSTVEECVSYEWNGTTYSESGTYQEMFLNVAGCDSTATLNLTILETTSSTVTEEACESYEWNGVTYTSSGTYQEMFTNAAGCDSTAVLNLTILQPDEVDVGMEVCGSYEFGTQLITLSGTYTEVFTNQVGCDSTVNLAIGIIPVPMAEIEVNGVVLFANQVTGANYQWYDCETNEAIEGEDKRQLTPPRTGQYYVEVSTVDCSSISECVFSDWVLATHEQLKQQIKVYPTTTSGDFTLDLGQEVKDVSIHILSVGGKVLSRSHHDTFSASQMSIEGGQGMYIIQVMTNEEIINTQRILIK